MLEALVAGTTDPDALAELARGRLRSKLPALREALHGRFRSEHALLVRELLGHVDYLNGCIDRLSAEIAERLREFDPAIELLCTIPGVQRRSAEVILAETGGDMSAFRPRDTWLAGRLCARATTSRPASGGPARPARALLGARNLELERVFPDADAGRRFVDSMPSADVCVSVLTAVHRNLQTRWTSNDIFDIDALSLAVPYCDVVATERHAWHVLTNSGAPSRLATTVVALPADLVAAIS